MMRENEFTRAVIGAAIEAHRILGPGMIEWPYEDALCREFHLPGLKWERRRPVSVEYKGTKPGTPLILDLLVEEKVIVDLKAKEAVTGLDRMKLPTYLRLSNLRVGLIINFNIELLSDGVARVVNDFQDEEDRKPGEPPDLQG